MNAHLTTHRGITGKVALNEHCDHTDVCGAISLPHAMHPPKVPDCWVIVAPGLAAMRFDECWAVRLVGIGKKRVHGHCGGRNAGRGG
jgi:hypothetical protein